ncbi:hypothetical protein C8J57DRAFT_1248033 [Mycena rebaudengoi]|nr:hypothetical protein C8J57DRAFT_1248033 [Mycena rebaudengoi]
MICDDPCCREQVKACILQTHARERISKMGIAKSRWLFHPEHPVVILLLLQHRSLSPPWALWWANSLLSTVAKQLDRITLLKLVVLSPGLTEALSMSDMMTQKYICLWREALAPHKRLRCPEKHVAKRKAAVEAQRKKDECIDDTDSTWLHGPAKQCMKEFVAGVKTSIIASQVPSTRRKTFSSFGSQKARKAEKLAQLFLHTPSCLKKLKSQLKTSEMGLKKHSEKESHIEKKGPISRYLLINEQNHGVDYDSSAQDVRLINYHPNPSGIPYTPTESNTSLPLERTTKTLIITSFRAPIFPMPPTNNDLGLHFSSNRLLPQLYLV